jgi:hypothetical protein
MERPRRGASIGSDSEFLTSDDESMSRSSHTYKKKKKRFKRMFKRKKKMKGYHSESSVSSASASARFASRIASPFKGGISGEFLIPGSSGHYKEAKMTRDGRFKVMPDAAYPNTYLDREELRAEMNLPSAYYHDLRDPYKKGKEIGQVRLEVMQCFGLPASSMVREVAAYVIAVCGSNAFKTDSKPPEQNPMWLQRMRRACMFPIFHAYDKIYIGCFDSGLSDASQTSDFIGRVVIDVSRLRAGCMYDITLPLRQSAQVFTKQRQGAIRIRMHLIWVSERSAVMSYIPSEKPKFQPDEGYKINCLDERSFRNVANLVHGCHMPGKFSMTLLKATVRELNFNRIHVFRYIRRREIYNLCYWVYPFISGFVFCAWMHSVYTNTVRFIPGHILTYFLMRLYLNYAYYSMDSVLQNGFTAPSIEELFDALLHGTKGKRKKYIKALNMQTDESLIVNPEEVMESAMRFEKPNRDNIQLSDIADAMRKSVRVQTYKHRLRTYRNTFQGNDAVDFLTHFGYAYTRSEAVILGRRLATELKLFEHVGQKYDFEDEPEFYHFLDIKSKTYIITGHTPRFKSIFRSIGFVRNDLNPTDDHVEFPFAEGTGHPRFTVNEALVVRSSEAKKNSREKEEAGEIMDCAEFGVAPALGGQEHADEDESGMLRPGEVLKTAYKRSSLVATATMNATANLPQTVMNLPQNISQNINLRRRTMEFGDPNELYERLKDRHNPALDLLLESKERASAFDLYADDSDDDVDYISKKRRKGVVIEEKKLKLPPDQDLNKRLGGGDKPFAKSMLEIREKIHGSCGHLFNDRVFKIDTSLFPPKHPEKKEFNDSLVVNKRNWMGRQRRKNSNEKMTADEKNKNKDPRTPYDAKVDEYERILQINKYSHTNPWINRVAVVVQPMIEILQVPLFLSRAGFNLMTWQDPILSFWVAILGPILVLAFHFMPYRIIFGITGVYLFGPQNWLYRLFGQAKPGYEPPNFDKIIKKKKSRKQEEHSQVQLFSSMAPGNQHIKFKNVDPQQVKQVVVPNRVLKYNRFYDWPPEPEFARVYQAPPPRNLNIKKDPVRRTLYNDDVSEEGYESTDSYWYDATLARKKQKKKRKGIKKVGHQVKKGAGVVVGTTVQGAGAVVDITGAVVGTTVGATMGMAKGMLLSI